MDTEQLKMNTDLIIKPETIKWQTEKIGGKLPDIGISDDIFIWPQKDRQQKQNETSSNVLNEQGFT